MTKIQILILAGGDGSRFGGDVPKPFLLLNKKPILHHTFASFLHLKDVEFTLVLNKNYINYWKDLCLSNNFNVPHKIVPGGLTRFHSVAAGLATIPDNSIVLIHDAVRPFASKKTISNVLNMATKNGNAVPSIPVFDSVRLVYPDSNKFIDRKILRAIQTPQGFKASTIKKAYNQKYNPIFTDDAAVLESIGKKINIVDGNIENIKITNKADLLIAECFEALL